MRLINIIITFLVVGLLNNSVVYSKESALPITTDEEYTSSMTITPSVYEEIMEPGETETQAFELTNNSKVPLPIKSYIRLFDASDEYGGVSIEEEPDQQRLSPISWTEVSEPYFILQPGSKREVRVNFNPPKDLPPGGYYAILFFEPLIPESFLSETSINIASRIGALLFLISPGDIIQKGEIVSLKYPKYTFSNKAKVAKIDIENLGNIHLKPHGKLIVTNLNNRSKREFDLEEFTVLPGKIREKEVFVKDINWLGAYRIEAEISYGKDNIVLKESKNFYHIPVIDLFAIVSILVFIFVMQIQNSRKRIKLAVQALFNR